MLHRGIRQNAAGAIYRLGLALSDLNEPEHCLKCGDEWVFGPGEPYEQQGDEWGCTGITLCHEERIPSMDSFNRLQQGCRHIIFRHEALRTGGSCLHGDKTSDLRGNQNHACTHS